MITHERVKQLFTYHNGQLIWNHKRGPRINQGDIAGSKRDDGYIDITINGKLYKAHRLIYLYHYDILPEELDHINGIRYDNRIENLRPATRNQQIYNTKLSCLNTSGTKGVSYYNRNNKWYGKISINGKVVRKSFIYKCDAINWVNNMRQTHHGEFANKG
jgi:hypothetical protein